MKSYVYTREAVVTAARRCPRCGAQLEATVQAIGSSGAIPDHLDTLAARERALAAGLAADVRRTVALVPCPSCRARTPRALGWAIARVTAWFAAVPILPVIAPGPLDVLWLIPAGLAVGGATQLFAERARLRRAAAAHVRQLAGPTRPPVEPGPRAPLPVARVTSAPPPAPPASPAPVVEAPLVPRPDGAVPDAPRLLRDPIVSDDR